MAHIQADRVKETSTTTGTGTLTLAGAATGFRTFASVMATSDTCWYAIQGQTGSEWEVGLGTLASSTTLTRTTVLSSSNAGAAVNLSAGTKDVFLTTAAARLPVFDNELALRIPLTTATDSPATPPTDVLALFARKVGGRMMIAQEGPSGLDTALQPFLARNKVGYWCPPGNATTAPGVFGYTALTGTTATARNVATTNMFTRMRRLGYVSAATAGSLTTPRIAVAQFTMGVSGTPTLGGFFKVTRFGCSDAATVSGARQFVGMSSSTSAATNVEPSTLTNAIGVGHGSSDTNLKMYYGGSAAQTPVDLGANFPANTLSTDVYELALFNPAGVNNTVYYQVTRLNTGHVASGTLTGTAGTALPANTTLLCGMWAYRTNNATALAVGLDIMSDYIETDQ